MVFKIATLFILASLELGLTGAMQMRAKASSKPVVDRKKVCAVPAVCRKHVLCIGVNGQYRLGQSLIVCYSSLDIADRNVLQVARDVFLKVVWNETSPAIEEMLYRNSSASYTFL